jgi:hypothetical protein
MSSQVQIQELATQPAVITNSLYLLKTHYIPGQTLGTWRIPRHKEDGLLLSSRKAHSSENTSS